MEEVDFHDFLSGKKTAQNEPRTNFLEPGGGPGGDFGRGRWQRWLQKEVLGHFLYFFDARNVKLNNTMVLFRGTFPSYYYSDYPNAPCGANTAVPHFMAWRFVAAGVVLR